PPSRWAGGGRSGRPPPVLTPEALAVIRAHGFPGNVRELEHWVESAIVLSPDGRITRAHLPGRREATGQFPAVRVAPPAEGDASTVTLPLGLTLEEATRR